MYGFNKGRMRKLMERIMTTKELADYIKLNEKTVIKMALNGKIPGVKIGAQWRFHLDSIDAYVQNDILKSKDEELDLIISKRINIIPLSRLINEELINLDFKGTTTNEVLAELVSIASNAQLTSSEKKLMGELKKREKLLSTAIGNGIALPHPRHPSSELFKKPNIIFLRSKKGVHFRAPDKNPVHLFLMTCAPNEFAHLRLLAKISKLVHVPGIEKKFLQADSKEEIVQILLKYEREKFLQKRKIGI